MKQHEWALEVVGWISTVAFLLSIVVPRRVHLHALGVFTAVTTAAYAYGYGATAIWVKWVIAFFFHLYMWRRTTKTTQGRPRARSS